ncbi:MAG: hypothetical protein WC977_07295 [Anaerovoracaceae bacterium]|jgi:DNA-binding XRE family transcriptional regulator
MTKNDKKETGEHVRAIRERLGYSRDQLGAAIGVSAITVKQVELGFQNLGGAASKALETLGQKQPPSLAEEPGTYTVRPRAGNEKLAEHLAAALAHGNLDEKAAEIAKLLGCSAEQAMKAALIIEMEKAGGTNHGNQ